MDFYLSNLNQFENLLFHACPIMGLLGGLIHIIIVAHDWSNLPKFELTDKSKKEQKRFKLGYWSSKLRFSWVINRLILGATSGFIVFLFILGSIKDGIGPTSKVLILAFLAGLTAPTFFRHLEQNAKTKLKKEVIGNKTDETPNE